MPGVELPQIPEKLVLGIAELVTYDRLSAANQAVSR
jgi:hypothetical protein